MDRQAESIPPCRAGAARGNLIGVLAPIRRTARCLCTTRARETRPTPHPHRPCRSDAPAPKDFVAGNRRQ